MTEETRDNVFVCGGKAVKKAQEGGRMDELVGRKPERRGSPYWSKFLLIAGLALMPAVKGGCAEDNATNKDVVEDAVEDEVDTGAEDEGSGADAEHEADTPEEGIVDVTGDLVPEDDSVEDSGCIVHRITEEVETPTEDLVGGSRQRVYEENIVETRSGGCEEGSGSTRAPAAVVTELIPPLNASSARLEDAAKNAITPLLGLRREVISFGDGNCIESAALIGWKVLSTTMGSGYNEMTVGPYTIRLMGVSEYDDPWGVHWITATLNIYVGHRWYRIIEIPEGWFSTVPLEDGSRIRATQIDVAGGTARVSVVGPDSTIICDGESATRESDGVIFVFRMAPEGSPPVLSGWRYEIL